MLSWMFITNTPEVAKAAYAGGVNRLFVDWEIHNKQERQGHLDTVISRHSYEDAVAIRQAVPDAELLIRLNPFHDGTEKELEQALNAGADLIMLPMFTKVEEVSSLCEMVNGRAGVVPLVETAEALEMVESVAEIDGVYELYVGLNDLHRALNMKFMFEPVAHGMLDRVAKVAKKNNRRFGFGGIAKLDDGMVSGEMVLAEHLRLGSDAVILSRTFYREDAAQPQDANHAFSRELEKLRKSERELSKRNAEQIENDQKKFQLAVKAVVERN